MSLNKPSTGFGGKVHFWTERRLKASHQIDGLSGWRGGRRGWVPRSVLFIIFIHDLQKEVCVKLSGLRMLLTLGQSNERHNVGTGASAWISLR